MTSGNPSRDARLGTISGTPEPAASSGGISSRTVRSARNSTFPLTQFPARRIGRGITTAGQVALMTLGYRKVVIKTGSRRDLGTRAGSASPVRGFGEPHRNPTTQRHGGRSPQESHGRNGTPGTLVMYVKDTENSRSAVSMRVSWAVGGFSR